MLPGLSRDQAADRIHKFLTATQEQPALATVLRVRSVWQDWMLSKIAVFVEADAARR